MSVGNPSLISISTPINAVEIYNQFQVNAKQLDACLPILEELRKDVVLLDQKESELNRLGGRNVRLCRDTFNCWYLEPHQQSCTGAIDKLFGDDHHHGSGKGAGADSLIHSCLFACTCCCCGVGLLAIATMCITTACCPWMSRGYKNPSRDSHQFKLNDPRHPIGEEIDTIWIRIKSKKATLESDYGVNAWSYEYFNSKECIQRVSDRIQAFQDPLFIRKFVPLLVKDVNRFDELADKEHQNSVSRHFGFGSRIRDNYKNYSILNPNTQISKFRETSFDKAYYEFLHAKKIIAIAYDGFLLTTITKDLANIVLEYLDISTNQKQLTAEELIVHDEVEIDEAQIKEENENAHLLWWA